MIFLTSRPEFQHFADFAILDQRLDDLKNGRVLADVCDSQLQIPLSQLFNGVVAFGKSSAEGLFHVDVTTRLSRRNDHVVMLVNPSRTNGHHVELFLREHFTKVRINSFGVRPFLSGRAPLLVLVGKRDNVNIRQFRKGDIDAVSIVAFARATNDSHSNTLASRSRDRSAELRRQDSRCDGC
jgi:hypothetical protein